MKNRTELEIEGSEKNLKSAYILQKTVWLGLGQAKARR